METHGKAPSKASSHNAVASSPVSASSLSETAHSVPPASKGPTRESLSVQRRRSADGLEFRRRSFAMAPPTALQRRVSGPESRDSDEAQQQLRSVSGDKDTAPLRVEDPQHVSASLHEYSRAELPEKEESEDIEGKTQERGEDPDLSCGEDEEIVEYTTQSTAGSQECMISDDEEHAAALTGQEEGTVNPVSQSALESSSESDVGRTVALSPEDVYYEGQSHPRRRTASTDSAALVQRLSLSHTPAEAADSLVKTGFLKKLSPRPLVGWQRRWFVLNDKRLMYFRAPDDVVPAGRIDLSLVKIKIQSAGWDGRTVQRASYRPNGTKKQGKHVEVLIVKAHKTKRVPQVFTWPRRACRVIINTLYVCMWNPHDFKCGLVSSVGSTVSLPQAQGSKWMELLCCGGGKTRLYTAGRDLTEEVRCRVKPVGSARAFELAGPYVELVDWIDKLSLAANSCRISSRHVMRVSQQKGFWKVERISPRKFSDIGETGDVLLFRTKVLNAALQRVITRGTYDHVALLLRSLEGRILVLESMGDTGVIVTPWDLFTKSEWFSAYRKIVLRRLRWTRTPEKLEKLLAFVKSVIGRNYELTLSKLMARTNSGGREEGGYFCSELVAKALQKSTTTQYTRGAYEYACIDFSPSVYTAKLDSGYELEEELLVDFTLARRVERRARKKQQRSQQFYGRVVRRAVTISENKDEENASKVPVPEVVDSNAGLDGSATPATPPGRPSQLQNLKKQPPFPVHFKIYAQYYSTPAARYWLSAKRSLLAEKE